MPEKKRNSAHHDPGLHESGYQLFKQGLSHPDIARRLGLLHSTIQRWSSRQKWKLRLLQEVSPSTAPREAGSSASTPGCPPADIKCQPADSQSVSPLTFEEKQAAFEDIMSNQALRIAKVISELPDASLVVAADKIKSLDATARKALKLEAEKPGTVINIGLLAKLETARSVPLPPAHNLPTIEVLTEVCHTGSEPAPGADDARQAPGPQPDGEG